MRTVMPLPFVRLVSLAFMLAACPLGAAAADFFSSWGTCGNTGQACCTDGGDACLYGDACQAGTCVSMFPAPSVPTGICTADEIQCGVDCAFGDPNEASPVCYGLEPNVTVYSWCFSDYEGPFYACPAGPVEGGGTRYACTYVNNDPSNCGQCGFACAPGQWCSSGTCR